MTGLKRIREQQGLTQAQLAERTRLRQTFISDLECGRNRNPSFKSVLRLARALGVPPESLFPFPEEGATA